MRLSDTLGELGKALADFHAEMEKVGYDSSNPQFHSKYVSLDALIDATKPILAQKGLSVIQSPLTNESGEIGVKSLLLHESGEFIESDTLYMKAVRMQKGGEFNEAKDPQAAGSLITYLRRYSYQAILNLSTGEDDDGNKASGRDTGSTSGNGGRISTNTSTEETSRDRQTSRTDSQTTNTAVRGRGRDSEESTGRSRDNTGGERGNRSRGGDTTKTDTRESRDVDTSRPSRQRAR